METRPENYRKENRHPQGKKRIKNITNEVEEGKYDYELDSILPKTDWDTHMAMARTSSARMKAAALKSRDGQQSRRTSAVSSNHQVSRGDQGSSGGQRRRPASHIENGHANRRYGQSSSSSGRTRRSMIRPATASQLSREFEEDDRKRLQRQKKRRRKKSNRPAKIIAAFLVLLIIIGSVFLITLYTQGSNSNQKGLKLYADGDYAQAADMFQKALAKDDENSEYMINLGMAYIALGQYEDALMSFDQAISHTNRSELLELAKRGSGIVYLSSGHYTKAADLFNEALSYGPDNYGETEIDILYYLAEAQDGAGDTMAAAESYSRIIEYQEDANAYMLRGLAYQSCGDNVKAEEDLKTALNMSKKNYKIYLALYEVLTAQNKTDEAAQVLDEALNLGGKTGEDYSNRGIVYMYQEDYVNASDAFNTALEKGYNNAYLGLAESLMRQKDFEGAAQQYENYIAVDTTNAIAYNQYGLCLMELERYEEARQIFETGIALNDRLVDKELRYNEAVALEYLNDWEAAYTKMQEFVEKYPDDTQGLHELTFLESTQQ